MTKSCMTCAWCACRNYGKEFGPCIKYIEQMQPIKKIDANEKARMDK